MRLIRVKDYREMSRAAANFISAQIILKPESVLGLATGSSPIGAYDHLAERYRRGELDFSQVRTVNLDEYLGLAPDHPQSYRRFMEEHLFRRVNLPPEAADIPRGAAPDPEAECRRYDAVLRALGGIDLQLLGLGVNGHIGFNEPAEYFPKGTHVVELAASTRAANRRFFSSLDETPARAISVGIDGIMGAKRVLMVVSGANKADAVQRAFFGPVTPRVPASILQLHPDVTVVADEEALKGVGCDGV